jgi:hypothetical protein
MVCWKVAMVPCAWTMERDRTESRTADNGLIGMASFRIL